MKYWNRRILFLSLLVCSALPAPAQEEAKSAEEKQVEQEYGIDQDLEGFFEEELVTEIAEEEAEERVETRLLKNERVTLGGFIDSSYTLKNSWNKDYPASLFQEAKGSLEPALKLKLNIDAKPKEKFRVFASFRAEYPFEQDLSAVLPGVSIPLGFRVYELFSDFNMNKRLFFRSGKQTIKWGVGYFFSPADVLNLQPIDPRKPKLEREGPLALKSQLPLDIHTLYLYLIANEITKAEDLAWAPKAELVLGDYELGIGGFYRRKLAPRGILTLTGPFPLYKRIFLFSELVAQNGSDKRYVKNAWETYRRKDELILLLSGGFRYSYSHWRWAKLWLSGQYFYNEEGYRNPGDFQNYAEDLLALQVLSPQDLDFPGRHYAALSWQLSDLFNTEINLSLSWLGNLSDHSGVITPTLSWTPEKLKLDYVELSLSPHIYYGEPKDEFRGAGDSLRSLELELKLSLGTGIF